MSSLQAKLQHKYALSEKGAKDMMKAFVSVTISNLVLMFPVWMLYFLVRDYLQGTMAGRGVFYIVGCILCLLLIALTTLVQYRATFLATYVESGVRRIALAEQLRKIPLSFFGKKDLSDLTSTIMADCATMETASSHFIPELGWLLYLHYPDRCGYLFPKLENGDRSTVGTACVFPHCGMFRQGTEELK